MSKGGASTGGVSKGGASTGGVSKGGVSIGGASTGGVSKGGVSVGGASAGNVSTANTLIVVTITLKTRKTVRICLIFTFFSSPKNLGGNHTLIVSGNIF